MSTATITRKPMRAQMTEDQARSFGRYSEANAGAVKASLPCGCEPYVDVFTYPRWQALGYQVQRGEHGVKLPVILEKQDEDDDGNVKVRKLLHTSAVFCRCQVKAANGNGKPTPKNEATPVQAEPTTAEAQGFRVGGFYNTHKPVDSTEDLMKGWKELS